MSLPSKVVRIMRSWSTLSEAKPRTSEQRKGLSCFVAPLFLGMYVGMTGTIMPIPNR